MNKQIDLVEEINKINPKSLVLFTTYTYNQDFFEREVFPRFKDRSYPIILIDQNEYQKNIKEFRKSKYAERKYFIEQIASKHTFHPKILLAISEEKIWFFIGSNNLTYDGFLRNAELVVPIVIDLNDPSELDLIPQIKDLLGSFNRLIKSAPHRESIQNMINILPDIKPVSENNVKILHNLDQKPIFTQILELIDVPIKKITVLSPYFSQEKSFFQKILKHCENVHIVVQQKKSNLPVDKIKSLDGLTFSILNVEDDRFLHAKAIYFETDQDNYIFSGSANFSESALMTNNNAEIGILLKSNISVSTLIKRIGNISPISVEDIKSQTSELDEENNVIFQISIIEVTLRGSALSVKINSFQGLSDISLILNDTPTNLSYQIKDDQIIFSIPDDILNSFESTVVIKIQGIQNGLLINSNYHLVNNKTIFSEDLSILNYIDSQNKEWLFRLLNKIMKLPNSSEYIPVLLKLDENDMFGKKIDTIVINTLQIRKGEFNPKAQFKGLIESFISKHQKRALQSAEKTDHNKISSTITSFILTNKLIFWSVTHGIEPNKPLESIEYLYLVKNNLESFFKQKNSYLLKTSSNISSDLLKESQLKHHVAVIIYVVDYLQKQSKKFEPDPRLGYNPVKDTFETSMINSLNRIMIDEDNNFNRVTLQELIEQYAEIVPELLRISVNDLQTGLDKMIDSVEIKTGKKMSRIIVQ